MWVRKDEAGIRAAIEEKKLDLKNPMKPLVGASLIFLLVPLIYALGIPIPTFRTIIISRNSGGFFINYLLALPTTFIFSVFVFAITYWSRLKRRADPFENERDWYCPHCNQGRVHQGKHCAACGRTGIEPFEFYSWVEEPPTE